jgi:hypothetical protein
LNYYNTRHVDWVGQGEEEGNSIYEVTYWIIAVSTDGQITVYSQGKIAFRIMG